MSCLCVPALALLVLPGCGGADNAAAETPCEQALVEAAEGAAAAQVDAVIDAVAADGRCTGESIPGDVVYPSNEQRLGGIIGEDLVAALRTSDRDVTASPSQTGRTRTGACGAADALLAVRRPFRAEGTPTTPEEVRVQRERLETMIGALEELLDGEEGSARADVDVVLGAVESELDRVMQAQEYLAGRTEVLPWSGPTEMFGDRYVDSVGALAARLEARCDVQLPVDFDGD
jgi:hypothetical protein